MFSLHGAPAHAHTRALRREHVHHRKNPCKTERDGIGQDNLTISKGTGAWPDCCKHVSS